MTTKKIAGGSPAATYLFFKLQEELGEVTQALSKFLIQVAFHPNDPEEQEEARKRLSEEIADVMAVYGFIEKLGYINEEALEKKYAARVDILEKKLDKIAKEYTDNNDTDGRKTSSE
jgi:NTP pyrophosphatase (non-canonical NTP hydrolase)